MDKHLCKCIIRKCTWYCAILLPRNTALTRMSMERSASPESAATPTTCHKKTIQRTTVKKGNHNASSQLNISFTFSLSTDIRFTISPTLCPCLAMQESRRACDIAEQLGGANDIVAGWARSPFQPAQYVSKCALCLCLFVVELFDCPQCV